MRDQTPSGQERGPSGRNSKRTTAIATITTVQRHIQLLTKNLTIDECRKPIQRIARLRKHLSTHVQIQETALFRRYELLIEYSDSVTNESQMKESSSGRPISRYWRSEAVLWQRLASWLLAKGGIRSIMVMSGALILKRSAHEGSGSRIYRQRWRG